MGRKNQIYCKYVRILNNPDDNNEIYLVLSKDQPMDKKYIKQFDEMFSGKDVIITINTLIRHKDEEEKGLDSVEETKKAPKRTKKAKPAYDDEVPEALHNHPLFDVP